MDQLLADLDVEPGIRVLQDDVFLRLEQRLGIERAADASLGESVDVGPFARAGAAGRGVPLLAESVGKSLVLQQGQERLGALGRGPWVLVFQDVCLKVLLENLETPASKSMSAQV